MVTCIEQSKMGLYCWQLLTKLFNKTFNIGSLHIDVREIFGVTKS